jgi:hypothetical protein
MKMADGSEENLMNHLVFSIVTGEYIHKFEVADEIKRMKFIPGAVAGKDTAEIYRSVKRRRAAYGILPFIPGQGVQVVSVNIMKLNQLLTGVNVFKDGTLDEAFIHQISDSIDFMGIGITPEETTRMRAKKHPGVQVLTIAGEASTYDIFTPEMEEGPQMSDVIYACLCLMKPPAGREMLFNVRAETPDVRLPPATDPRKFLSDEAGLQMYFYVSKDGTPPPEVIRTWDFQEYRYGYVVRVYQLGRVRHPSGFLEMKVDPNIPILDAYYLERYRDANATKLVRQLDLYVNPMKGRPRGIKTNWADLLMEARVADEVVKKPQPQPSAALTAVPSPSTTPPPNSATGTPTSPNASAQAQTATAAASEADFPLNLGQVDMGAFVVSFFRDNAEKQVARTTAWTAAKLDELIKDINEGYIKAGSDWKRFFEVVYVGRASLVSLDETAVKAATYGSLPANYATLTGKAKTIADEANNVFSLAKDELPALAVDVKTAFDDRLKGEVEYKAYLKALEKFMLAASTFVYGENPTSDFNTVRAYYKGSNEELVLGGDEFLTISGGEQVAPISSIEPVVVETLDSPPASVETVVVETMDSLAKAPSGVDAILSSTEGQRDTSGLLSAKSTSLTRRSGRQSGWS